MSWIKGEDEEAALGRKNLVNIHILQHEAHENAGHILDWAKSNGLNINRIDTRAGVYPNPDDVAFLIVLGGALNTNEEDSHPWLTAEKDFIQRTTQTNAPILGICLGSQLLAEALGARIKSNPVTEVGWHDITFDPQSMQAAGLADLSLPTKALEWHSQTFDIPPDGFRLASSDYCVNQAFIANDRHIGLQFHPEWTKEITQKVAAVEYMAPNGHNIQSADHILTNDFTHMRPFLFDLLDHLVSLT